MNDKAGELEDRILQYIDEGIKQGRFTIYERHNNQWYGIHLKKYLSLAVGVSPSKCSKILRKLKAENRISILWQLWGKPTWEIGVRLPEKAGYSNTGKAEKTP